MTMDFADSESASGYGKHLTARDRAICFLDDRDLDAQLQSIRQMFSCLKQYRAACVAEIDSLNKEIAEESSGNEYFVQHLIDTWVDENFKKVFDDAVFSMAAIAMIAPLVESIFVAIFKKLGECKDGLTLDCEASSRRPSKKKKWDPRWVMGNNRAGKDTTRKDLLKGIDELLQTTNLQRKMPDDLRKTLEAIIGYRNANFHNGFEWGLR